MKFALGKMKFSSSSSVEEETINRWRQAAMKIDETSNLAPSYTLEEESPRWNSAPDSLNDASEMVRRVSKNRLTSRSAPAHTPRVETAPAVKSVAVEPASDEESRQRWGGRLRAALNAGTVIHGRLTFDSPVQIDGTLTGEVFSTSTLVVGHQGMVEANIQVGTIVILGNVKGPVEASELVEIRNGGRLEGNVRTDRIAIEEGGVFNGECLITRVG